MGIGDVVLIVLIVGGAVYLLYRSLWKKKGYCTGVDTRCSGSSAALMTSASVSSGCGAAKGDRISPGDPPGDPVVLPPARRGAGLR